MKIKVFINGQFKTEINSVSNSDDLNHIKNIALRTLPRRNIILNDEFQKIKKIERCYNCENLSQYELDSEITKIDNIFHFHINDFHYKKIENHEKHYCGKCLTKLNANSVEYVSKICNISTELANKIILERNKSPFYSNNHKSLNDYKNWQKRDENWYIKKYGEEGILKYKQNILKWQSESLKYNEKKDSMSFDYCLKKCNGDAEKAKIIYENRKKDASTTIDKYIERYGKEEGTKKYFERSKYLAYCNSLEYYKKRYGEKGLEKYNEWKNKCSITLDTHIKRYGEKVGEEKYKKWLTGVCKPLNKRFYSKESYIFFEKLQKYLDTHIQFGEKERFIYDTNGFNDQHIFFYDAYIEKYNLIIEYDTPFCHQNKNYLTEEEISEIKYFRKGDGKDEFKENLAKVNGFIFYRVFVKNKSERKTELEKLIKYIENL